MPWIAVDEPHAKPPRPASVATGREWSPPLTVDRGWAELASVVASAESGLNLSGCRRLEVTESALTGITLTPEHGPGAGFNDDPYPDDGADGDEPPLSLEIRRSVLEDCDLSQVAVQSVNNSTLRGCKLTGADFSGGTIADTVFERCTLRYGNLRMAKLNRTRFVDCVLDEVDGYQLTAQDVSVPGSSLVAINLDRLQATRLDLREAAELSFTAVGGLSGCLVAEHQLAGLAPSLAMALGIDVEHPDR